MTKSSKTSTLQRCGYTFQVPQTTISFPRWMRLATTAARARHYIQLAEAKVVLDSEFNADPHDR